MRYPAGGSIFTYILMMNMFMFSVMPCQQYLFANSGLTKRPLEFPGSKYLLNQTGNPRGLQNT